MNYDLKRIISSKTVFPKKSIVTVWFNLKKRHSANTKNFNQTRLDQIKISVFNKCDTLGWTVTAWREEEPKQTQNYVFLFSSRSLNSCGNGPDPPQGGVSAWQAASWSPRT